jgi:molybdopterin-containing oxidoreductase family iron-sulfur binding subunit
MAADPNRWSTARSASGLAFWRSIEELLDTPEWRARAAGEFPPGADMPDGISRRDLLRLLGATAALAGAAGCMQEPRDTIVPYSRLPPAGAGPGQVQHYATACTLQGFGEGLLVKAQDGRPLKIDGSPEHPATLGGSSIHQQALLFELYDPQRAQVPTRRGLPVPYEDFLAEVALRPDDSGGAGTRFLLEPTSSPSIGDVLARIQEKRPRTRTYFHSPMAATTRMEGLRRATGRVLQPRYDLTQASVIVSFGEDLLCGTPFSIRYSRQFADRRRMLGGGLGMNRLYAVETDLSVTGMTAEHRLARRPGAIRDVANALLAAVATRTGATTGIPAPLQGVLEVSPVREDRRWVEAAAGDLARARGNALVVAGDSQTAEVHAAVHAMNVLLGSVGRTVTYGASPLLEAGGASWSLATLADEIRAGEVKQLVIVEGNPAGTSPADLGFRQLLARVPQTAYCGLYANETAQLCEWFIPASQTLERWEDSRAVDGTLTFTQPLIRPLYETHTPAEMLSAFVGDGTLGSHALLTRYWAGRAPLQEPAAWDRAIQHGFVPGTAFAAESPGTHWDTIASGMVDPMPPEPHIYELNLRPDTKILDGRFANNLWLLELADPVTKASWDNAALISPATAVELGVEDNRYIRIARGGRTLDLPVLVLPGHADGAITIPLGYGAAAKAWGGDWMSTALGMDGFALVHTEDRLRPPIGTAESLPKWGEIALTQTHWAMEGRPIAIARTWDDFRKDPNIRTMDEREYTLFPVFDQSFPDQWGMAIDLTACTGCSACVTACQAENNIPVVGKQGVLKSREMHWIRIDRYFSGDPKHPGVITQPMLCQHCEKAPCEYVCPVNATTHSPDGINEMTYNRCVGTRFCQNNCPYKVRRFNWFDYNIRKPPTLALMMNPEVTVRARGVIEKCNYCVQRIRTAQIEAEKQSRRLRDLEVMTACQQACPTGAIMFGNVADPNSQVSKWMRQPRTYQVLEDLGTRPRTRYLARITNPNPELA